MDTWLQIRIRVPDDALTGNVDLIVWRALESGHMIESAKPFEGVSILPTMLEAGSANQWTVTALRDVVDRIIAKLLADMERGKEMVMLQHDEAKIP